MKSIFGRINFVRKFTLDFTETVKTLQRMIHNDVQFKWTNEGKESLKNVNTSISETLLLRNPGLKKYFYLYTLSSY
jgi:hypothetical protein